MKGAVTIAKPRPRPKRKSKEPQPNHEAEKMTQARKAVSVVGLIFLAGFLALTFMPTVELPLASNDSSGPSAPDYPSREEIQKNWPRFRGPGGLGISTHERIPVSWDSKTGEGILWKTEILLPGNNSPIAWGDRVFIAGADEKEKAVFCYSADTGDLLWRGTVNDVPSRSEEKLQVFEATGYAASTMTCDGSRVYAIFADGDIACFDFDGKRLWAKNLGLPDSIYNYSTSLTFYHNRVLVQYDQGEADDGISALIALEGKTGQIAWQKKRPVANAWTTPILIDTGEGEQLITCSEPWVIAYEPDTGEELWRADLMGTDLAPSPIYAQGLVLITQPNETMYAIRTDGRGDITETHVAWESDCLAPDISSPVSNGELIFMLTTSGILSCYETKNGEMIWEHEIDDMFQASPSIVGDWLYLLSEEGVTYRVKAAKEIEQAKETSFLDEWLKASPAFMDGRIFIRGDLNLYCVGSE